MIHTESKKRQAGGTVRVADLKENPRNIRQHFDEAFIGELAESLKRFGFISPIVAVKDGTVVAGNQRFRAAKKAGIRSLVVGRDIVFVDKEAVGDKDLDTINAIENIMRRNLNYFEEAEGLWRIFRDHLGFETPEDAAAKISSAVQLQWKESLQNKQHRACLDTCKALGIPPSRAEDLLRLFQLSPDAARYVRGVLARVSANRVALSSLAHISTLPKGDHKIMVRGVVLNHLTATGARMAYKEWKAGLRDDNLYRKMKRASPYELKQVNSTMQRRDRALKELRGRGQRTREESFTFEGLLFDLSLLQHDIVLALEKADKEKISVSGLPAMLQNVSKGLAELKARIEAGPVKTTEAKAA